MLRTKAGDAKPLGRKSVLLPAGAPRRQPRAGGTRRGCRPRILERQETQGSSMLTQTKAKIALQSKSGVTTFECSPGERLLFAGLAHGLSLPYECATGTCGTCRGRVMEGTFETAWLEAPGAAKLKRDRGEVLFCQTHPGSDCVVRVAANVA